MSLGRVDFLPQLQANANRVLFNRRKSLCGFHNTQRTNVIFAWSLRDLRRSMISRRWDAAKTQFSSEMALDFPSHALISVAIIRYLRCAPPAPDTQLGVVHFANGEFQEAKDRFGKVLDIVEGLPSQVLACRDPRFQRVQVSVKAAELYYRMMLSVIFLSLQQAALCRGYMGMIAVRGCVIPTACRVQCRWHVLCDVIS